MLADLRDWFADRTSRQGAIFDNWQWPSLGVLQRVQEAGLILCCGFAMLLCLALFTFHPSDPGWSQAATDAQISNGAGAVGAWLADSLLFCFGVAAFTFPLLVALLGWAVFRSLERLHQVDYLKVSLRLVGAVLLTLSLLGLASLNANDIHYYSAGGLLGDLLSQVLEKQFNLLGTTLILLTGVGIGLPLATGISWLRTVDKLGAIVVGSVEWVWCRLTQRGSSEQTDELQQSDELEYIHELEEEYLEPEPKRPGFLKRLRKSSEPSDVATDESAPVEFETVIESEARMEPSFDLGDLGTVVDASEQPVTAPPVSPAHAVEQVAVEQVVVEQTAVEQPAAEPVPELPWAVEETATATAKEVQAQPVAAAVVAPVAQPAVELSPYAVPPEPKVDPNLPPLPTLELLNRPNRSENPISPEELETIARLVEAKLQDFGISAEVVDVFPGPVITRFELDLAPGVKVSRITSLSKDLARSLSAVSVRVVEVIPGKSVIGLELPNQHREVVYFSDVIDSEKFHKSASPLTMVLGKDIAGDPVVVDLAKMPHVLVAGTTGSGKSVGINTMILSLLFKSQPEDVRLILIDPKMLELSVYEGIPHLLTEVVTDMKDAANALRWCVGEMERRYKLMSALGVRNIKGYNQQVTDAIERGEPMPDPLWKAEESMLTSAPELEKLPYIVVVIDEFADMMMVVGKKCEELIARIAQKARAAGIHLVLATQRPSVNVVTGLIKANIPTRMSFQVSTKIDSRTVLDQPGAETLLGMGDMLYLPPGSGAPHRVHGAFVDDPEVHRVVADWKKRGTPVYIDVTSDEHAPEAMLPGEKAEGDSDLDPLYDEAVFFVTQSRRGSISSVQRKFKIGYNRAARIIEQMEEQGVVSTPGHNGNREVLAPPPAQ